MMSQLTVAMVEDDPLILRINRSFLAEMPQFKLIWEAPGIEKGWALFELHPPDLLLLDIYLPDGSGLIMLEKLKQKVNPPMVIMITAADESEAIIKALEMEVRDYLIKPYLKERFFQALNDVYTYRISQSKMTQAEVDQLIFKRHQQQEFSLPKGLNHETLTKIIDFLKTKPPGITADELAKEIGAAVVTIRRYLHFLVEKGKVKYEPVYGQQGRPIHRYFIIR